jgi:hypothetical protein
MNVFILWHVNEMPDGEEDSKLIGVYASAAEAEAARMRARLLPGFCDAVDGFLVDRYTVGEDHWTEGYITVTPEQLHQEFGKSDG